MPRDNDGNYSLATGNPVQPGTVIQAIWANSTMSDIAQGLTDSLDRKGRGGMLAPFFFTDGVINGPGASFENEPTSGLYRVGLGDVRMSILSEDVMRWQQGAASVWNDTESQWYEILTAEDGVAVPSGTVVSQTLRWDGTEWLATSVLAVGETDVSASGSLAVTADVSAATFTGGTFEGTEFTGGTFDGTEFTGGTFDGTGFTGGTFNGTGFTGGTFTGTDFTADALTVTDLAGTGTRNVVADANGVLGIGESGGDVAPGTVVNQTLRWDGSTWQPTSTIISESGGNVGVGTLTPQYAMDIANGGGQLRVTRTAVTDLGTNIVLADSVGDRASIRSLENGVDGIRFSPPTGAEWARIDATGRVGIGVSEPIRDLDVAGVIKTSQTGTANEACILMLGGAAPDTNRIFSRTADTSGNANLDFFIGVTKRAGITIDGIFQGVWNTFGVNNAASTFQKLTQAQYDGITPDSNTIYFIVG